MKLHIINTGSVGNCYVLESKSGEMLLIDAGVTFKKIQEAVKFKWNSVVGCLLSHEHGDHAKSIANVIDKAVNVYALRSTAENMKIDKSAYFHPVIPESHQHIKHGWQFSSFLLHHDVPCVGYLITHPECGSIVFATDTSKINYLFPDANHYMIEANYCAYKLADMQMNGIGNVYVAERVQNTHLSIQQAIRLLEINDLSNVQTVILIHLSDRNSDQGAFMDQVIAHTGKPCYIASENMTIDLDRW